jgi:methionine-rich copper-binding protein CopC
LQYSRCTARAAISIATSFVILGVLGAPAFGHAALTSSTPKAGAKLDAVPETVEVSYAEPPTTDAKFTVTDGCGNDVARNVNVLNQSITAEVSSGQPGDWAVEWSVVSAVDGHLTKDGIDFTVSGRADCDQAAEPGVDEGEGDSSTSFPVLPIAVGTVLIIGVALVLRSRSN